MAAVSVTGIPGWPSAPTVRSRRRHAEPAPELCQRPSARTTPCCTREAADPDSAALPGSVPGSQDTTGGPRRQPPVGMFRKGYYLWKGFTGKYIVRKSHTKIRSGSEWHILTRISMKSFPACIRLKIPSEFSLCSEKKVTRQAEDMNFIFSCWRNVVDVRQAEQVSYVSSTYHLVLFLRNRLKKPGDDFRLGLHKLTQQVQTPLGVRMRDVNLRHVQTEGFLGTPNPMLFPRGTNDGPADQLWKKKYI